MVCQQHTPQMPSIGLVRGNVQYKRRHCGLGGAGITSQPCCCCVTSGRHVFPINPNVLVCNRSPRMRNGKYLVCNKCKFPFTAFELFTYFLSSFEDGTYDRYRYAIQVCRYATGMVPWDPFYYFSTLYPHLFDSNSPYL